MAIIKKKFIRYSENKKGDVITVWLNKEEREIFDKAKLDIEQTKDSTAMKQLAFIGTKLLGEEKISYLLATIYSNKRKNKRIGIPDFE